MPQKIVFTLFLLTSFSYLWSQEVIKDSVWVSFYKDSLTVKNNSSKYSPLYSKIYKLPSYSKEELEGFKVRQTPNSLKDLLKLTYLDRSYTANDVKGTSLENSLREFEQFSYPFSSTITSSLAQRLDLVNSQPEYIAYKSSLSIKTNNRLTVPTREIIYKANKYDSVSIEARKYLRYRLLDFLVGSYAKKIDDVNWLEYKDASGNIMAIPYVDYYNNQFLQIDKGYKFLTKLLPSYKHLENYVNRINNLQKVSKPLFGLDVNLLSALDRTVWEDEVSFIQKRLSTSFLKELINKLPKPARTEKTEELLSILEERVAHVDEITNEYFNMITQHKIVRATNANDIIVVDKKEKEVVVNVFKEKKGKNSKPLKSFTFSVVDTKSIWVYGLKGNDYFEVKGKNNSIKIDLIGGKQLDKYEISSGNNISVYDSEKQTDVVSKDKAKVYLSSEMYLQEYELEKHRHKTNKLKPILGANPDDGVFVGVANQLTINKYKRKPFTQYHELQGVFYTGNGGFKIDYYGELAAVLFKKNAFAHLQFHSPNYSTNFFGYGNETPNFDDNLGLGYNRVKMSEIQAELGLKDITNNYEASVSLFFEQNKIDATPDRFVSSATLFFPDNDFFEAQNYTGVNTFFKYKNLSLNLLPDLVIEPSFRGKVSVNIGDTKKTIGKLEPQLYIKHPVYDDRVWLDANVNYQQVMGGYFEFYQAAYLGASNGLRGYRNQRFTGKSALSLSSNVKWNVKEIKSEVLPLQFGLLGGLDAGRVWITNDQSSAINTSYGAGFWLQSADLIMGSLQVFGSDEGLRFNFNLSFGF